MSKIYSPSILGNAKIEEKVKAYFNSSNPNVFPSKQILSHLPLTYKVILPKKILSQIYGNKNKIRESFLNVFCFVESASSSQQLFFPNLY